MLGEWLLGIWDIANCHMDDVDGLWGCKSESDPRI